MTISPVYNCLKTMKFSSPLLFVLTSFLLSFTSPLSGAKGIKEALFTWTDSPATTMNVIWLVKDNDPTLFLWGQADQKDTQSAKVKRHSFYKGSGLQVCQVQLTGLNPDTGYRVFLGDKEFRARTLSIKRPERISFVTGGDMMHSPDWHKDGIKAMASRSPSFALLGGDLAYANGKSWERWLDWIEEYADHALREDGYSIPFVVAIGNHEVNGGYGKTPKEAPMFYNLFPLPQKLKSFYTIDIYEDLSVVVLDSSHTYSIESQVEFLESSLSSRKDRTHLFALYHFPAYGIMKGGLSSPISKSMRKYWVPLFDQYGLDAAFENDHHVYKRSKLLKGDKIHQDGTLYIGDGAWGVGTRKPGAKEYWYVEKFEPTRHVIEVEIKDNVRTYRAINHDKKVFDEFIDKRDAD